MLIKDLTDYLESIAPLALQESYDNCGLIVGSHDWQISGVLVSLDCTEKVIDEAIEKGCNIVVAHHPIVFSGLKKLNGYNYIEKTVIKAIKNDVAIYAWHTNLDNVSNGVNKRICDKLQLKSPHILLPKKNLMKLVTFIPIEETDAVLRKMFDAGAGSIGEYKDCSFRVKGRGTFTPSEKAQPTVGEKGKPEEAHENRVEILFPSYLQSSVLKALMDAHPYEEVAHFIHETSNLNQDEGSGMIGELPQEMSAEEFLSHLKSCMELNTIKFTPVAHRIKRVAVCGGAGKFLLPAARAAGADAFVSSDFKYHEFFDGEEKILITDIGHYESEIFTKDLICDIIKEKFTTFAVNLSMTITNPISYY